MKLYPFQAIYPNTDLIASAESFFDTARNDFSQYYANGFFRETTGPGYYILEIRTEEKVHTGLIACLDVADYSKGKIVRHEETIASHEQVMLKVLLQRGSMVKPVLVAHAPDKAITKEIARLKKKHRPFVRMATTAQPHQYSVYRIDPDEGAELAKLYKTDVPKVYIADGHHRCSTQEKLVRLQGETPDKDYRMLLTAIFPFDQLEILDYNRIVQLPYNMKLTRFIAAVSRFCEIASLTGPAKPDKKYDITMVVQDEWYRLTWKPEILKKYKKDAAILDAHLLDLEILENILGITDVRSDNRVSYVSGNFGPEKVEEKASASEHHVGFCIYPVQFDELVKVSDSKGTLPPKSTWFEPRMINGLVVKMF